MSNTEEFSRRIIDWQRRHGRHDLPWQQGRTPYTVWVSEVMLQQTRVETVIPYFERFTARFPDVAALAAATEDEVLHHWSGLGYYSRGRNLRKAAQAIRDHHDGHLPESVDELAALPGIGRSTAGAILALALDRPVAILDGNVKRVLARAFRVSGWPGEVRVQKALWQMAEVLTPQRDAGVYAQGMMDLGATLCTRARPRCEACPVAGLCGACRSGEQAAFPAPRPAKALPVRQVRWLALRSGEGAILLERRPPVGVWAGLWGLPELAEGESAEEGCRRLCGRAEREAAALDGFRHTFSHFHLDVTPLLLTLSAPGSAVMDGDRFLWYNPRTAPPLGLPAPVARLLERLQPDPSGGDR